MVRIIVAVASNGVIGKNNDLIWHLPADMKFFTQTTSGHIVIMGRRNWDSIPLKYRPLSNRINVVVTRNREFNAPDCVVFHSIEEAINHYKTQTEKDIYIIGGGQIYDEALKKNLADEMYITHINQAFDGDTWFPVPDDNTWNKYLMFTHEPDDKNQYAFSVFRYTKKH